ncbi:MAG TPA: beta-N-acetylhexosaminidase [Burkholderiales bacterium]|jgi:beta-N-acetylhexosaminidase|nr:beta-N-acetylhexosaminidase [Burkholderiales bacterium]
MKELPLGPVMVDVRGTRLERDDIARLLHPLTGAVILFARNYEDTRQISELCRKIRALRDPSLLIAVDHEGGRVQRFREGFTPVPPMRAFGRLWDCDPLRARAAAREAGVLIALELGACGVDFSFTPVLDLDYGTSTVIGDRAFHRNAEAVTQLAGALIEGLREAGMASVGKHFPGHGFVAADSHIALPVDERPMEQIEREDLLPFARLASRLAGVMPAHVAYPRVDSVPAGFSAIWLRQILRERLGFRGVVFSDDLTMEGASVAGTIERRARSAFEAGCDMVLVCNRPAEAEALLSALEREPPVSDWQRLLALRSQPRVRSVAALPASRERRRALQALAALEGSHSA